MEGERKQRRDEARHWTNIGRRALRLEGVEAACSRRIDSVICGSAGGGGFAFAARATGRRIGSFVIRRCGRARGWRFEGSYIGLIDEESRKGRSMCWMN